MYLAPRTALILLLVTGSAAAQGHQHVEGMVHPSADAPGIAQATPPGQAAFGAIAAIVARLDADPTTDWSTVDLERLRQHLIDMDLVTMRSRIATQEVPGGFSAALTGEAQTAAAIRRMTAAHGVQMGSDATMRVTVAEVPGGSRLTVVAGDPSDHRAVARLRGLGAIGFLALGDHHGPHHEALARGGDPHQHN